MADDKPRRQVRHLASFLQPEDEEFVEGGVRICVIIEPEVLQVEQPEILGNGTCLLYRHQFLNKGHEQ